jgi:hypothetical protein
MRPIDLLFPIPFGKTTRNRRAVKCVFLWTSQIARHTASNGRLFDRILLRQPLTHRLRSVEENQR